ncbi:hypothetical protein ElyMa_003256500 [Elysia marginata]|uniref:Uncharacterized protein n=1 Tax=Elysia marginata TaxID=1093978 RepID=A0AAV4J651_9GAST|nr:hypothetical protein ElyMa_003256500 [Elysia marginata]
MRINASPVRRRKKGIGTVHANSLSEAISSLQCMTSGRSSTWCFPRPLFETLRGRLELKLTGSLVNSRGVSRMDVKSSKQTLHTTA